MKFGYAETWAVVSSLLSLWNAISHSVYSPKPLDVFLGEVVKWGSNPGEIADEPSVIGGKPEETSDFVNVPWMQKVLNCLDPTLFKVEHIVGFSVLLLLCIQKTCVKSLTP